jgi:CubicO group peptidase (beta-lactamase class C family)
MMSQRAIVMARFAIVSIALASGVSAAEVVEPARVDALAAPLVEDGWAVGLAVGLISEQGTQIAGYGRTSERNAGPPAGYTEFEIGSISKVFTGLILAEMVEDHVVQLTEPVQKLLGESMTVPKRGDREITLVDLATHTSGLPRMPGNFSPKNLTNPYADYAVEQLATFVSQYKLPREPGERSEYSNLGMGLLGHALALTAGMPYESLVRKRICQPLGMDDTCITLNKALQARLAEGHDYDGNPVANWDLPTLAGAGALRSTTADMLKFLAANLTLTKTPLESAIAASHVIHFQNSKGLNDTALAWQVRRDNHIIWHNGQTGGYHSFAGFLPEKRVGVVVLCNSATMHVDTLGFRLLELLTTGEAKPLALPKAIKLDAETIEPLVGSYKLGPLATATVTRESDQLLMQLSGQPKIKFYPESKTRFFCRAVEAAVTFEADEDGSVKQLVLHQNGRNLPAPRTQ